MTGKIYRGSDGSYHRHGTSEKGRYTVTIHNVRQNKTYDLAFGATDWTSQPLQLPPGGYKPPRAYRAGGLLTEPITHEGVRLYEAAFRAGASKQRTFVAPELNFQHVIVEDEQVGVRSVLKNIRIGEPPADVFVPPTDAVITFLDAPGGIVFTTQRK